MAPSSSSALQRLPLVTLYLTERCNSRCITCDYWRHGRLDVSLATVSRQLPGLLELQTRVVLFSGGEPLLNPQWADIARLLRSNGLRLWLLTSGLSLAKHAQRAAELFDAITVSLDGTCRETYAAIRGLDAFDKVCAGIREVGRCGVSAGLRVTVQRANYRELSDFVSLAHEVHARNVSFLAVDVANPHAFNRTDDFTRDLALHAQDLPVLRSLLAGLEDRYAEDFRSGFIAESPAKLLRIHQYFAATLGLSAFPPVTCNAPEFSAVIDARGRVHPCFFIPGPSEVRPEVPGTRELPGALNSAAMQTLRASIRAGQRSECGRCVCSLYRDPADVGSNLLS